MLNILVEFDYSKFYEALTTKSWTDFAVHEFGGELSKAISEIVCPYIGPQPSFDLRSYGEFTKNRTPIDITVTIPWSGVIEYKIAETARAIHSCVTGVLKDWQNKGRGSFADLEVRVTIQLPIAITVSTS